MALASLTSSKNSLPSYPITNSYTQKPAIVGTKDFCTTKFGDVPTTGPTFGYHDHNVTMGIFPDKLGVETHGPYSGTDITGVPDPLEDSFTPGKFSPDQWSENNYNKYYQAFADRDNSEKCRFESNELMNAVDARTKRTQADVLQKIKQRAHDINYWRKELERQIEDMEKETELLVHEKKRLEKALDATASPLLIATDCLKNRERRQDIDNVHDNVELQLKKEVHLIRNVQNLLRHSINEADKQIKLNRKAKHLLSKDWSDKNVAYNLDTFAGNLNNYTTEVMFRDGVDNPGDGNTTPESWAMLCHDNIVNAENERQTSIQLRGILDDIVIEVSNDQREQQNCVQQAFTERNAEMHTAKKRMEDNLDKTCKEIKKQEDNIQNLQTAIKNMEPPLKVAQSRLETRSWRPNNDLCNDAPQKRLVEEVQEIKASIEALKNKLAEAQQSRADLMETRRALETEIAFKQDSLFIDRDKCMTTATRYPTISRLVGYQ